MNIKAWISAFRLRTLPLSFSLIIFGSALAYAEEVFAWDIFTLAIITTLFLQILSNISNDYGDAVSGADFAGRVGPERAVQSGAISYGQMKTAIVVFSILSFISGVALLVLAYPRLNTNGFIMMLSIGIASIVAAICYTIGKRPYGYRGLGDLSVFVFFGLVGVMGSFTLYYGGPLAKVLLPASSIGLLSMGVLNMNNMRDHDSDERSGKNTLIVRFGKEWGRKYQITIVVLAFLLLTIYTLLFGNYWQLLFLIALVRFIPHLVFIANPENDNKIDTQLKVVSMGTLLVSVLFTIGTLLC